MFFGQKNKKKFTFRKKYQNPFLNKERKLKVKNRRRAPRFKFPKINFSFFKKKKFLILFVSIIVIIFLSWFLFFSNIFIIKKIEVYNLKNIPTENIERVAQEHINSNRWWFFSQNNLLIFDKKSLKFDLNVLYSFDELNIYKDWPDCLIIDANEKQYSIAWAEEGLFYYINYDGDIVLETNNPPEKYIKIYNEGQSKKDGRKINIEKKYLELANKLNELYNKEGTIIKIKKITIDNTYNTVKVEVDRGPRIYFSTELDLLIQNEKLDILLKKELKDKFNKQEYIDLRLGDKIFYK